ncbi:MAG TPA: BadF/BadG/BcrA/BcrD ATPase family protein, partial [Longimicrobiales bacterium]|nr:BadF/BadG/BcrA/BcrD ATPase family protein [Longimicrobiales bacterium]
MAKNIADTLFTGETVFAPLVLCGGVAKNEAVVLHLRDILGLEMVVEADLPLGAAGAALKGLEQARDRPPERTRSIDDVVVRTSDVRTSEHPALELRLSSYPAFDSLESSLFRGRSVTHSHPLEVDVYQEVDPGTPHHVYLGVDIGSTSTKAVVTDLAGQVLVGFYTATAGRPLEASQLILEGITAWIEGRGLRIRFAGMGTTGAGRKFVGTVLGADLVLDEITAHARAAVDLHPGVDTILEIGGQDSKFTTVRDGRVTLSVMNNVCAAGTGSFIEEQAKRLDVPLTDYAQRTQGYASPLASQRCTVFMERDLNHYLSEGYERGQVLAAVLHSVRENYLKNV